MGLKAVSLFSGAGGLEKGVAKAGFESVCAIVSDPNCAATLRRNALRTAVWQVDIRAIDPKRTLDTLGLEKQDNALLHGGPPHQPFSQVGRKRELHDPRDQPVFEMLRHTEALRPSAVTMEPVLAFLKAEVPNDVTVLNVMQEVF